MAQWFSRLSWAAASSAVESWCTASSHPPQHAREPRLHIRPCMCYTMRQAAERDVCCRGDERELFKDFMEDYNTCTMPHRKFYDLAAYQRKKAAERQPAAAADRGNISAKVAAAIEQDDERLRRAEMFAERKRQADVNAQDKYSRMLMSGESLKELQDREMTRLQAQAAYKTGDMETAKRLRHKLNPTDAAEERQQDGSGQQQY